MLAGRNSFFAQRITQTGVGVFYRLQSRRASLFRLAVAFAVFALAPVLGILIARLDPVLILLGIAFPLALAGLRWTSARPGFAPLIILSVAIFVPISLPTGTESRLVISLLLTALFAGLWVLEMVFVQKRLRLRPSPVNKPLLGFIVIVVLSLFWSVAFRDPLVVVGSNVLLVQTASTAVMVLLPGAFLLVANHIHDVKLLKAMVAIMLAAGAIGIIGRYSLNQSIVHDGGLFSMWTASLSVGLALFSRKVSRKRRGLLIVLAGSWVLWGFGLHISWLAGWLPDFVALGVILFMRSKKLLAVGLVLVIIIIGFSANYYLGTVLNNENSESGATRLEAWRVNWRITGQHLLLGTGPGGYAAYYMSYFPQDAMATHSTYVDVLAETGIIGFAFCMWFFFTLARLGYKLCLRLKGRGDFSEALANVAFAGTIGSLVAMGIGDWLFPFAYTQTIAGFDYVVYSWLFMGTILVLDRLHPGTESVNNGALSAYAS